MSNTISMQELFDGRIFKVPDYQRSYSWEAKQVKDFLDDIEYMSPSRRHYTGTVVLDSVEDAGRPTDRRGRAYKSFHVVDGQQRLTTAVLLFNAISGAIRSYAPNEEELAEGIHQDYVATTGRNRLPLPKVTLNQDTDAYFQGLVQNGMPPVHDQGISALRRLHSASEQIRAHLHERCQECDDPEKWLMGLVDKITDQMHFTLYETEDSAEVGIIFEVMNDRGKPLTDLEKVKNFLIYASTQLEVDNDLRHQVNDAWSKILKTLMAAHLESSGDEDLFLRSDWRCRYNPQPRDWKGIDSIKERFNLRVNASEHNQLLADLSRYTKGLVRSCVAYADAVRPDRDDAFQSFAWTEKATAAVKSWNSRLVRINVLQPIVPILMAVRERWSNDAQKYLEVLQLLEKFSFRVYMLKECRSDAGQASLFRLAHDIAHCKIDFAGIIDAIRSELRFRCGEEELHRTLRQLNLEARWYEWDGLKYMLYEYETHLAADAEPEESWNKIQKTELNRSIEHVLPQKIENRDYWKERFPGEEHRRYVHDIGNLTLTLSNQSYGNKCFPSKKGSVSNQGQRCYANSSLSIERDLTRWDDWTPDTIEERRKEIMVWARDRWSD